MRKKLTVVLVIIGIIISISTPLYYLFCSDQAHSIEIVNDVKGRGLSPRMEVDSDNNVYLTWKGTSRPRRDYGILFSTSNDSGESFSENITVYKGPPSESNLHPSITTVNTTEVLLSWTGTRKTNEEDPTSDRNVSVHIYLSRFIKSASSFRTQVLINESSHYPQPQLVSSQGEAFLLWIDRKGKERNESYYGDLYLKKIDRQTSSENSSTPSLDERVGTLSNLTYPSIAANDNGEIYIVWEVWDYVENEYVLKLAYSDDKGESFRINDIRKNRKPRTSYSVCVGPDGRPYLGYDERAEDIYVASLSDQGEILQKRKVNDEEEFEEQYCPRIAVEEDGTINVVWLKYDGDKNSVFYSKTEGIDASFTKDIEMGKELSLLDSQIPTIETAGQDVFIAWSGTTNEGSNIYFVKNPQFQEKNTLVLVGGISAGIIICTTAVIWRWKKYGELW